MVPLLNAIMQINCYDRFRFYGLKVNLAKVLEEVGHIQDGRLEASLYSSKCDVDIFGKDSHGRSALMIACKNGLKGVVKYLLERGAEVDERYIAPKDDSYLMKAEGLTPLMIACRYGYGDVVKDLLASGADPNLACHHKGNTPLHYASMPSVECSAGEEVPYTDEFELCTQLQKVDIVRSVLQHGAKLQVNNLGLSPVLYAALQGMTEVVHFYLDHEGLNFSTLEKVEALEMCAVSLNIMYMHFDLCSNDELEKKQNIGYEMLMKAKLLKRELSTPIPTDSEIVLDLVALFGRGECKTVESLRMLANDRLELMVEAFLVSGRIFPVSLRDEWLWKPLLSFAHSTYLKAPKRLDKSKDVFAFCWRQELAGKIKFGTTLTSTFRDWQLQWVENDAEVVEVMICGALEVALNFLNILEPEHMAEASASILKLIGYFIAHTLGHFQGEAIDQALVLVETIIKAVHSRLPHGFLQGNGVALSFCHELIHTFTNKLWMDAIQETEDKLLYKRMLHIICRFLFLEDASHCHEDGSTMLHSVVGLVCLPTNNFDIVIPLSQALVRHGCPINADGNRKSLARFARQEAFDSFIEFGYYFIDPQSLVEERDDENEEDLWSFLGPSVIQSDKFKELMSVLTPGSGGVLRLEELATRTILRHGIRYRDVLPKPLDDVIEKNIYDVKLCEMES